MTLRDVVGRCEQGRQVESPTWNTILGTVHWPVDDRRMAWNAVRLPAMRALRPLYDLRHLFRESR